MKLGISLVLFKIINVISKGQGMLNHFFPQAISR